MTLEDQDKLLALLRTYGYPTILRMLARWCEDQVGENLVEHNISQGPELEEKAGVWQDGCEKFNELADVFEKEGMR